MNRTRYFLLVLLCLNFALIGCFLPYDYVSIEYRNIPTFDGFYPCWSTLYNRSVNTNFLMLEVIVVAINGCIGWLLSKPGRLSMQSGVKGGLRTGLLVFVALNLVLILLFPPFEQYFAVGKAAIPSFEGFRFVFGNNVGRQLVAPILYLEVILLLVNAGLILLFLKDERRPSVTAKDVRSLAKEMQKARKS